jgi:hypothetical protein
MLDTQQIELLGRNRLVNEIIRADLEVSIPIRDRGIDLIVYADRAERFSSRPIQMKSSQGEGRFQIDKKYEKFPDIIIAFVWHLADREKEITYALTYTDTIMIATEMGYTETHSWRDLHGYSIEVNSRLRELLKPYVGTPGRWRALVLGAPADFKEPGMASSSITIPAT